MTYKINTYFAMLIITIAGSFATLIIVDVATTDIFNTAFASTNANYSAIDKLIIKNRHK